MTIGVLLCCWGKPGYGYAAFNMGATIRHHAPDLHITLITDGHSINQLSDQHKSVFSEIIVTGEAVTDPGRFKVELYEKCPYDYTLYLDVDALCTGDLRPVIERLIKEYEADPKGKFFRTHVYDWYTKDSPDDMPMMYWAKRSVIWDRYGFNDEKLPATQSSIQFIAKCPEAEKFYKSLQDVYINDPLAIEELKHKWGGTQPDELYLNITIARFGFDPHIGAVVWFGDNISLKPYQAEKQYPIISYFGAIRQIKSQYVMFYDSYPVPILTGMGFARHQFKYQHVSRDKHANKVVRHHEAVREKLVREAPLQSRAESEIRITPPIKKINVYSTYYKAVSQVRQRELDTTLLANLNSAYTHRVIVLAECELPFKHEKLEVITHSRPTMAEVVITANEYECDFHVMLNSDIEVTDTISQIQTLDLDGIVLCLSRWERHLSGKLEHYSYEYSQDAWVWSGDMKFTGGDYNFGVLGCDNKFAHDLNQSGYELFNPSRHIKFVHNHLSNARSYSEANRLPRPYRNVPVCMLNDVKQPVEA